MKYGREALIDAGFPLALGSAISTELGKFKYISVALRAGQMPNTNKGFGVSPKPIRMKTKTSSSDQGIPLIAGFIPWDQETFGRPHSKPIPQDFVPMTLYVSLREIMNDINKGNYKVVPNIDRLPIIEFTAPHATTTEKQSIIFSINLTSPIKPLTLTPEIKNMITPWQDTNSTMESPAFWEKSWGDFDEMVDKLYPVHYHHPQKNPQSLTVAASLTKGGILEPEKFLPVTGDADLLWIAIPSRFAGEMSGKQYNASDPKELELLVNDCLALYKKIIGKEISEAEIEKFHISIANFAKSAGIITPFELMIINVINNEFEQSITYFDHMLQHGPETNNPGEPSPLDGKILHFYKGLPILTENENELVEFALHKNFLEQHYIRIHPGWDTRKWSPVIKRQIELNQPIHPETLNKYHQFLKENTKEEMPVSTKLTKSQSFESTFRLSKKSLFQSPSEDLLKKSFPLNRFDVLGLGDIPYEPEENQHLFNK